MPLARIVSSTPDQVATLSEYLRSRGYEVEVIAPASPQGAPADLHLDVEGCSSEQAIARAREAADAAEHPGRQPVAYDITGRPVAFADQEEPPAPGRNALAQAWNGLRSASREMMENLSLSIHHVGEWFAEGRGTIRRRREHSQETRRQARQRSQEARRQAEEHRQREREASVLAQQVERARRQEEEAARASEQTAAQARRLEHKRRQEKEDRERRLLEQYRREARRDVVRERFQAEQLDAQQRVAPAETTLAARDVPPRARPISQRENDWKWAAAAGIVIALLATLGYAAYQNREPAAPISNRALVRSQSVSQTIPFGAATVAPPATARATRPASQGSLNPNLPQHDAPVAQKLSTVSAANKTIAKPARPRRRATQRRRSSRSADGIIAEDQVIVYHDGKPTKNTASSSTGPKRISDLDQ